MSTNLLRPLDAKVRALMPDRVILKPLTRWNEAYKEFPRFVMEFLCMTHVDPDKILPERYARGYGFLTSYFAEVLSLLRRENYQTHVNRFVDFGRSNDRDQTAVKKTASGLLKLLYPHRTPHTLTPDELQPCLELAMECRQRIIDSLKAIAPAEFNYAPLTDLIRAED